MLNLMLVPSIKGIDPATCCPELCLGLLAENLFAVREL